MGREVRMVPPTWKHPTADSVDGYQPLHGGSFAKVAAEWNEEKRQWDAGFVRDYSTFLEEMTFKPKSGNEGSSFDDWHGERPVESEYMPDWPEAERTHLMMYETCTEGTPLSPPMATPEELARYLADTGASAFGGETATYDQWLKMIRAGWAPSAVFSMATGLQSGVAAAS